jgi:glycosyltransferase involved in cell wall biosynthesis
MPEHGARVAILLCTCNGERFLQEQLDSYAAQTHGNWTVWASDDASSDGTRARLERQRQAWGPERLAVLGGPGQGGAANFMSLVRRDGIEADYFAFSDQDDVWQPDKLARAVAWLDSVPADRPALYCSRVRYIDEQGREIGLSPLWPRPPAFANALVQNIAGGNTMVFNRAARRLIGALAADVPVVVHDWWAYQVVTGGGGLVRFDPEPTLRYRQHAGNLIGANAGWLSRLRRAGQSLRGLHRGWLDIQLAALATVEPALTAEHARTLALFRQARRARLPARLSGIMRSGVHRQTRAQDAWFRVQVLLDRV